MSLTQMCASHLQASKVRAQVFTEAEFGGNTGESLCASHWSHACLPATGQSETGLSFHKGKSRMQSG